MIELVNIHLSGLDCYAASAVLTIGISAIILIYFSAQKKDVRRVPMPPKQSLFWGHQKSVFERSAGSMYSEWFKSLKCMVIRIRGALFKPDILIIVDPQAISHILNKRIFNYPHSDVSRPRIERMLGRSLGWVEGKEEHKRMHTLLSPSFSAESVRKGAQNIFDAGETLCRDLEDKIHRNDGDMVIDITIWMQKATLDAIGRFAFGHDFVGGTSPEAEHILGAWRGMAKVAISLKGFYGLMLLRRFPFLDKLPLSVLSSQGNVRKTIQETIGRELVKRNQALITSQEDLPEDFLFQLLKADHNRSITRSELLDHVAMFTIAGSETTAQALSYGIWELSRDTERQRKLRSEVLSSSLNYDEIQNMPYLDAVTREILRFHPPTPYMERTASEDDVIPLRIAIYNGQGYLQRELNISAGQTVIIPIHTFNRLDDIWGDGDIFRPERWTDGTLPPQDSLAGGWSNIMTFSDGPRICTGYRLAIFEFKVFLAYLIKQFEFLETGVAIADRYASTMNPVVIGRESDGPMLPIRVSLVRD